MDGYDSTCPRCGAVLTAGGCMSCGYPSLRLEAKVGSDTSGGGVAFVKFEVLAASMKRVSELEAMYETSHASRMHAEDCVRRLEAENAKLYAALLDLYNAHQDKKVNGAMRASGRWTQIKGLVGEASDREFRVARAEVDEP